MASPSRLSELDQTARQMALYCPVHFSFSFYSAPQTPATSASSTVAKDDEAASIAAMFKAQTENWEETQEKMSQSVMSSRFALCIRCNLILIYFPVSFP